MRQIGTLPSLNDARRLCDYLLTQDIHSIAEPEQGSEAYEIWVRDEDQLEAAQEELERYRQSPSDPRYDVKSKAEKIRQARVRANKESAKLKRDAAKTFRDRGRGMAGGPVPVTVFLIVTSVIVTFLSDFGYPTSRDGFAVQVLDKLRFISLEDASRSEFPDAFASIKKGEVWRLLTPIFPHFGPMHLLFNMFALWVFGSALERLLGRWTYAALILVTALAGNLAQVLLPPPIAGGLNFFGISGVVYGLFGYVLVRGVMQPTFPVRLPPMMIVLAFGFLVAGIIPNIGLNLANGAHLGGLFAGIAMVPITLRASSR